MPLFSIIIPTYNVANKLHDCLHSIHHQTCNNYEIIVMDGASTDNLQEVIQQHQALSNHIRLYIEKDNGVYDAMNKGIAVAKGDWIIFLGADDAFYSNQVLQHVADFVAGNQASMVYGDAVSSMWPAPYDGVFTLEKLFQQNICHQAIFYRRAVFASVGHFDTRFKAFADWHLNLRLFLMESVTCSYMPLTIARFAPGGISSNSNDEPFFIEKTKLYKAAFTKSLAMRVNNKFKQLIQQFFS